MVNDTIEIIETFPLRIPRDTPYLGALENGNQANQQGYFIRPGNQTIYSIYDHSVLVKITTRDGVVGWGECFGVIAPQVTARIITEVLSPLIIGRDPFDAMVIQEDLYNGMHVRGFFGGYYVDAIAGIDIALWDLRGRMVGLPVHKLLGGLRQERIPAYISGLPMPTISERVKLAKEWQEKGFNAFKIAAVVSYLGELADVKALREALGSDAKIMVDFHWKYTAQEAIKLITAIEPYDLYFAEAPCAPEDIEGLTQVVQGTKTPVAIGEELRTVFEYRPRFINHCMSIIQPEMGHTGISSFWNICQLARAFHCKVMPHATIGVGLFMAASLQVTATLENAPFHEYQHSIFDRNLQFIKTDMKCEAGYFHIPTGIGIGAEPKPYLFDFVIKE
jgi:L-alanine-DL-glutamate epimerase-like enolase superfamily enzyme